MNVEFIGAGTYMTNIEEMTKQLASSITPKTLLAVPLVVWYLNPAMDQDEFEYVATNLCDKVNGFVTFNLSDQLLKNIIYEVSMYDLEEPPRNTLRKIIFKDTCRLTPSEKLKIVGRIIGYLLA